MNSSAASRAMPAAFVHQALIYGSEEEFTEVIAPFVREGRRAREPTLVAVQEANVEALRRALGHEAQGVELLTDEQWYENPTRTRAKFADWVGRRLNGHRIRLVGEPPWPVSSPARIREWARHESVLNIAFAELPVTVICPYDARALPPSIIDHARGTHPEICVAAGSADSETFVAPKEYCRRLAGGRRANGSPPVYEMALDSAGLSSVRRLVEQEGQRADIGQEKVWDLVLAVNEIATNALVHGVGPATVRVWRDEAELIFEVHDCGGGVVDPLAGQLMPDPAGSGGRGLWMARMAADAIEISSDAEGGSVSVHLGLPPTAP